MKKKAFLKVCMLFMIIPLLITVYSVYAFSDYQADYNYKGYSCWAGLGTFTGNVTYQIGGTVVSPNNPQLNGQNPFPLSKLQFPLNVTVATIGNEFAISKNVDIRGEIGKNITTYSGKQQDTDYSYTPGQPLFAYSSNDADVQTITADIGFRYWVSQQGMDNDIHIKFGIGGAYLYENLSWRLSNLNQISYFDDNGDQLIPPQQSAQPGIIGTYQTTTSMPYIEIAAKLEQTDAFSVLLSLGYSPFAQISDEDNHILRQIDSTTNLTGNAYKVCVQAKYNLSKEWFLMGKWDWITYDLTGTENDLTYGSYQPNDFEGDAWTEGHEISSTQSILTLSVGAKF